MSRNWMVAAALAAVLAIVLGAWVGRQLLTDDDKPAGTSTAARPQVVAFHETVSDVSLSYPGTWVRVPSPDPEVPLLVVSPDKTAALQVRRSNTGLDPITRETLAIGKKLTDRLIGAIKGTNQLATPEPVEFGGLVGWRYRYTRGNSGATRDHYFMFKGKYLVALVFEAQSASRYEALAPQFERIASSLRDGGPG